MTSGLFRKRIMLVAGGVLLLGGGATVAQTPMLMPVLWSAFNIVPARAKVALPPEADRSFVEAAHAAAAPAAELRRLGFERAEHAAVRSFLQTTAEAGAALLPQLPQPDATIAATASDALAPLMSLRGVAFDRALMDAEIQLRSQLVEVTEQQARAGLNAELRQLAAQSLVDQRAELVRAHAVAAEIARTPAQQVTRPPVAQTSPVPFEPKPVESIPAVSRPPRTSTTELNLQQLRRIGE
jgi:putative membrane protein